jgi:hypothetical protein
MSETVDESPYWMNITYSGDNSNVTPYPLGGGWHFGIPAYTYEMPTLETAGGTVYSEGVNYTVSGMDTLVWTGENPTPDWGDTVKLKAPVLRRINPALMSIWAKAVNVTLGRFASYSIWGQNYYKHLKYFIWALAHKQCMPPTLKNLSDGIAIARGAPFSYVSGLLTYDYIPGTEGYGVHVGGYDYILPSGLMPIPSGAVAQFDVIASGILLSDYVSDPALVALHASSVYSKPNTVVVSLTPALQRQAYSQELYNVYVSGLLPCQYFYSFI